LIDGVTRLSGGKIDGIIANAGGGPPQTMLSLNFFGAVATLEGLRPLLQTSPAPRAVAVSSIASFSPVDSRLVEACLGMDEAAANATAREYASKNATLDAMTPAEVIKLATDLYANSKHALNRWCRRAAVKPQWAGAGIPLNVVAPGFIDTPAAAYILSDPERRASMGQMVPMRGVYPARPEQMAAILGWCVSPDNSLMTGQILFVDGGAECLMRGENSW
jgi:NAD(P)-dependent dehydrogenase (short-subunit alcohol dehydrogenase family)